MSGMSGMSDAGESAWVVAVDVGGTHTRVALARTTDGVVVAVAEFRTELGYPAQLARLAEAVADAGRRAHGPLAGIGVSLGGRIARDGSGVEVAPNLRVYEGRPLVQQMSERCGGLPVRLAHDAVCGLLAERWLGALVGVERCAYLTLSTGTGCAVHLEAQGSGTGVTLSIELGHQLLDHNQRACLCGQVGCLETYTGGRQLALRYSQPIETLPEAEQADLWRAFVEKLSLGLVNLAHLTRVERVAVGGAIALNHPALLPALSAAVDARLRNARLDMAPATLGAQAPLVGAAALLTTPSAELAH